MRIEWHDQDDGAPARLREGLAGLHRQRIFIPPEVDAAVVAAARTHLAVAVRPSIRAWRPAPWLAAAAAVALLAWFSQSLFRPLTPVRPTLVQEDVNRDGRVDILDAFKLARSIEQGDPAAADLNGDGRADQHDVEVIAARSVRLGGGS